MKFLKGLIVFIIILAIAGAAVFATITWLFGQNDDGYYEVRQGYFSGDMSVRSEAGLYFKFLDKITRYNVSDINYFSKSALEGGTGEESDPITVRFSDGGTAEISGSITFRLSLREEDQLALHKDYKNYQAVKFNLVNQVVTEALKQTASLMKSEEAYSTRRGDLASLTEDQVRRGLFATDAVEVDSATEEGLTTTRATIIYGDDGLPVVKKQSSFARYNIEILQFTIKDIDFDETIDALITRKKQAEQERVVAEELARKADQEAITAEREGRKITAEEEAKALAIWKPQTIEAEERRKIAEINRAIAEEEAAALLIRSQAEAEAATLLVQAGLPPQVKADIEKQIALGVAAEMAKIQLPDVLIIGGENGGADPFQAVGLESFLNIKERLENDPTSLPVTSP